MNWPRIGFVLLCLIFPVVWGVVIHRLFEWLHRVFKKSPSESNSKYPDYQI